MTAASAAETPATAIVPHDGFNLQLVETLPDHYLVTQLATPAHNWFAGTFTHLPTATPVTIGLSMAEQSTERNTANVRKWRGLVPVMTYADPTQYTSYEWFTKDVAGRWVSGDPFKQGDACFAGTGTVPTQQVIPAELAQQFLSKDGTTWSPWREVDAAEAKVNINCFRITQTFARDTATVAMRVPYTFTYEQVFLQRLQAAHCPGVTIDEIGKTPEGRPLQVVRCDPPAAGAEAGLDRPTVLVYAREHATEPDGSWAVQGMLTWLLSEDPAAQESRRTTTWLLIPLLDPDAAVRAEFRLGDLFRASDSVQPEALAYATYLIDRLNTGGRLDLAINLHNVECLEGPNFFVPQLDPAHQASARLLLSTMRSALTTAGVLVTSQDTIPVGTSKARLAGWCASRFGTLDLACELNSRYPAQRMSLATVHDCGVKLAQAIATFLHDPAFASVDREIRQQQSDRSDHRARWWAQVGRTPATRNSFDLFTMGY